MRSGVVYSHRELDSSLDLFTLADVEKSAELLCRQFITKPLPEDIIKNKPTVPGTYTNFHTHSVMEEW